MDDWMNEAACRADPVAAVELFPTSGTTSPRVVRAARRFCGHCPVIAECLAFAEERKAEEGVWGGRLYRRHTWTHRRDWTDLLAEESQCARCGRPCDPAWADECPVCHDEFEIRAAIRGR